MYHLIRRVHLFTGLLLLVFVLMYFVTGYVMVHGRWFGERTGVTSTRTTTLDGPVPASDEAMSRRLQEAFALPGQRVPANRRANGSVQFNFVRPGTTFEAVVAADGRQVTITRRDSRFSGLANGLHRLHGYGGGRLYDAWSLLYDLASAALIVFAVTGVCLWHQSTTNRLPGWLCLGTSMGFTASMVLYLLFRK